MRSPASSGQAVPPLIFDFDWGILSRTVRVCAALGAVGAVADISMDPLAQAFGLPKKKEFLVWKDEAVDSCLPPAPAKV